MPDAPKSASLGKNEGEHNAWFRAKVAEALNDPRPYLPNEKVKAQFQRRRAEALRKEEGK